MRLHVLPIIALALAAAAQQEQPAFRTGVNVVVAPTVVTNRAGDYVNGLQSKDFQLTDNGKIQDIRVDVTYVPMSLVVAVQANAAAEPVLPKVQKIGSMLSAMVAGDQGEIALLGFDHRIQLLQDFTSDANKVEEGLKKLKPGSSSSRLTDAVVEATRMLSKRPPDRRRVLLLISETRDYGSEAKVREALTQIQLENVSVYTVNINRFVNAFLTKPEQPRYSPIPPEARGLPAGAPPTPDNARQMAPVTGINSGDVIPAVVEIFRQVKGVFVANPSEVFTRFSGGREESFVKQSDLERAIQNIGSELHSEYLISYTPSNRAEGGFHEIQVTIPEHPSAKIRTRPGYWVAAQY